MSLLSTKHYNFQNELRTSEPLLYMLANRILLRHPQLERVVWRGVDLAANDGVEMFPQPQGNVVALVDSSDKYGRYAVTEDECGYKCECPHFIHEAAPETDTGQRVCKHISAVILIRASDPI